MEMLAPRTEKSTYCLLGYDAVTFGRSLPTFRKELLSPSSGSKSKLNNLQEASNQQCEPSV
jgi:hypothetical protein